MPRVPSYEPNQVQEMITPRVQSNVRVSREALGGGESAQAVFGASNQLAKTAVDIKQRITETMTKQGDSLFSKAHIDAATKIKSLQGRNAAQYDPYIAEFDKQANDIIEQGDYDADTKDILKRVASARSMDLYQDANNHMVGELEKYEKETHAAHLSALQNEAVYYYGDRKKLNARLGEMKESVISNGYRSGQDEATIKDNLAKLESDTHLKVINQMIIDGKDSQAIEFYNKEAKLYGDDVKTANSLIEDTKLRYESTMKSDKIIAGSQGMSDALEKARDISDPKLRDETTSRIKQYFADKKSAENQDVENLHRRATDYLDGNPDVDSYAKANPADWSRFSLSERQALKNYAAKKRSGEDSETDFVLYYDLRLMAAGSSKQQDEFKRINLADPKILNNLGKSDRETLVDIQTKLREGRGGIQEELDGYRSAAMIVNDELKAAGINPNANKGSKDAERVANFRAQVDQQITALQSRTNKKATTEEIQSIVSNLLTPAIVGKKFIFFDDKKPYFEVDQGQEAMFKYDDIPLLERQDIESKLRKAGRPVTENTVIEIWIDKTRLNQRGQ